MENVKSKITYHQEGDYLIPNLTVPNDENENYRKIWILKIKLFKKS